MALLSTTMIILFGMVVGIGHLVQAKVNLQNAVDLAAMSGASWQARYLDTIGLINYRMRQNYKFAVYDIYVTQSRFNTGLINAVNQTKGNFFGRIPDRGNFNFGICQQAYNWHPRPGEAPFVSGDGVASGVDLCQLIKNKGGGLPPIIPSPVPNLNPILIAANLAIIELEKTRQKLCTSSSGQNSGYFKEALARLAARQRFQFQQLLKVLDDFDKAFSEKATMGSGLADSTISKTFESNLISANRAGYNLEYVNPSTSRAFRDSSGPGSIATSFEKDSAPTGNFSEYFQRQRVQFKTLYAEFQNCDPKVLEVDAATGTNLGISRARTQDGEEAIKIPFSIVLKATVQPNILFWPQGLTPTLVAIGAAKPFGSRVGPSVRMSNIEVGAGNSPTESSTLSMANMSFYPGDIPDGSQTLPGIGHGTVLRSLLTALPGPGGSNGESRLRPSVENPKGGLNCIVSGGGAVPFLCLSLAPTLYEGLFWNVYPFPAQKYSNGNASITAEFPWDLTGGGLGNKLVETADNDEYFLPDRMINASQSAADIDKWHETVLIGNSPEFQNQGCPAFFADQASVASSWSPDVDFGDGHCLKTNRGRRGYQIKLIAVKEVCREIRLGASLPANDMNDLKPYCDDEAVEVNH